MARKTQRRKKKTLIKRRQKLPESAVKTLNTQRERIFAIHGIVNCAYYASDSLYAGTPNLAAALRAAQNLLEDVAEALEEFIPPDCGRDDLEEYGR